MNQQDLFELSTKPWNAGGVIDSKAPLKAEACLGDSPSADGDQLSARRGAIQLHLRRQAPNL
jgi:hypothetical protein